MKLTLPRWLFHHSNVLESVLVLLHQCPSFKLKFLLIYSYILRICFLSHYSRYKHSFPHQLVILNSRLKATMLQLCLLHWRLLPWMLNLNSPPQTKLNNDMFEDPFMWSICSTSSCLWAVAIETILHQRKFNSHVIKAEHACRLW